MRGLSPEHLVRVWERGVGLHPTDRALSMLRAADPETEWAVLCDLPIGERDRRLLELREQTFGRELDGVTSCTRCGSRVELRFSVADVSSDPSGQQEHIPLAIPGTAIGVRLLTSRDLAIAARCVDAESARRVLAARCIEVAGDGALIPADTISEAQLEAIARALDQADPSAVCTLHATCPTCHAPLECELDIADFLWTEIEAAALRLLRDVHALARAYGWQERDILAMTPLRRRAYLELVQ